MLVVVLITVGCASSSPEPDLSGVEPPPVSEANQYLCRGALEAVEIQGHPRTTIVDTVESVVTAAGLTPIRRNSRDLVFERRATRSEQAAYGNWMGDEVRFRLRVECTSQGADRFLVQSRCYVVRDNVDEQLLARRRAREYAHLLADVWRRLN